MNDRRRRQFAPEEPYVHTPGCPEKVIECRLPSTGHVFMRVLCLCWITRFVLWMEHGIDESFKIEIKP